MNAYEIVMESRQKLVEQVISNMKKGYIFTEKKWDAQVLAPQNPVSHVCYKGGNRIRLIQQVVEKGYQDPRWMVSVHVRSDQRCRTTTGVEPLRTTLSVHTSF